MDLGDGNKQEVKWKKEKKQNIEIPFVHCNAMTWTQLIP